MDEINVGEIVYATITVKDTENKERELKKVVFSRGWECNYPKLLKEKVQIQKESYKTIYYLQTLLYV